MFHVMRRKGRIVTGFTVSKQDLLSGENLVENTVGSNEDDDEEEEEEEVKVRTQKIR